MGKYLIRIEAMDGELEPGMAETYGDGIECDGFVIIGDTKKRNSVAIHRMNIDGISDAIAQTDNLLSAAILAKAKHEVIALNRRKAANTLSKLFESLGNMEDTD